MMRKLFCHLCIFGLMILMASGCLKTETYGDFLHDKEALKKAIAGIKEHAGHPTKVTALYLYPDGTISFERQDPQNKENLDAFKYLNGQWNGPEPIQLVGDSKLDDNVFDIDTVNLMAIPDLVKQAETAAKENGMENAAIKDVSVSFSSVIYVSDPSITVSIENERKSADLEADKDGNNAKFEID